MHGQNHIKFGELCNLLLRTYNVISGKFKFFLNFILEANPKICENCEIRTREKGGMTVPQPIKTQALQSKSTKDQNSIVDLPQKYATT